MQYNLNTSLDREKFVTRVKSLLDRRCVVDLTEKAYRTHNQNSYLHLLLGVVAMETGNTLEDVKRIYFKEICNPAIFRTRRTDRLGNTIEHLKSSADLNKEEMSIAIDRFKRWGAENGIFMPNPGDTELLREIEIEMGRNRQYL